MGREAESRKKTLGLKLCQLIWLARFSGVATRRRRVLGASTVGWKPTATVGVPLRGAEGERKKRRGESFEDF